MKMYNEQRNAQVFNFFYLFTSALHVSGFLLAHLQRQVCSMLFSFLAVMTAVAVLWQQWSCYDSSGRLWRQEFA
jgi:hypothetical protein